MELSPGQQRGLFVALVIALAGLGIYLIGPGRTHRSAAPATSATATTAATPAASSAPAVPPAVIAPTPLPVPAAVKGANIYSWLPFSQHDLDAAANVTLAFAAADETFSYTDTPASYGGRLANFVTPTLQTTLEAQFQPPGAAVAWKRERLSSRGSGTIIQISSFGAHPQQSITFVVSLTEQTTASGTTKPTTAQYDVTVVAVAGGWQVNDIEQAGAGNP
jgi:hypothetical protein